MSKKLPQITPRPVAPPVYRPQPVPKVLQKKPQVQPQPPSLVAARKPIAPPVYRPVAVQRKETPGTPINRPLPVGALPKPIGPRRDVKPTVPPVYRPQPMPKVLQRKEVRTGLVYPRSFVIQRAEDRDIMVGHVPVFAPADQSDEEVRNEVKPLIEKLEQKHRLVLSQSSSLGAMRSQFAKNQKEYPPQSREARERNMLRIAPRSWLLDELEAFGEAADLFAPILGEERLKSIRGATPQEIVSIGKLSKDPDFGTTMAETFQKGKNITVYEKGVNKEGKEPDYSERMDTFIHELTHGLLEHRIHSFVAAVDYWASAEKPSGKKGGEKPPNSVARKDAYEDMAESVMMYLTDDDDLRDSYPQRYAICKKIIEEEFRSLKAHEAKLRSVGARPALRVGGRRFAVRRKR